MKKFQKSFYKIFKKIYERSSTIIFRRSSEDFLNKRLFEYFKKKLWRNFLKSFFLNLLMIRRKDFIKILKRNYEEISEDLLKIFTNFLKSSKRFSGDLSKIFWRRILWRFLIIQKKFLFTWFIPVMRSNEISHQNLLNIFWRSSLDLDEISQLILRKIFKDPFKQSSKDLFERFSKKIFLKDLL